MKSVLIAGGSGGIGAAVAREAAKNGWGVVIGYATGADRAEKLVAEIKKSGGSASALSLPLDNLDALQQSLGELQRSETTLNALVLSASPPPVLASFLKTEPSDLQKQFQVNVVGTHRLLVEVWKNFFRGQKSGHVVGVLSEVMGTPPWPHMTSYVIAKRGLQCLLECALAEFGTSGLQVDAFSVDYTETPMLLNVNEHVLAAARSKRPGGQLLKPHDVATAVVRRLNQPSGAAVLALEKIPQTNEPT